ncbi:MAG: hypothetical protein V3R89_09295 [Thermoanaerobaculia bacterium]
MDRSTRLVLSGLTLFLVLFPLVPGKPGLPPTLKADEPAYYLMAQSLARDGDLLCEPQDLRRLFDEFPFTGAPNVILMSDDSWHTLYFGKPAIYSLFAAPLAALFGSNGLVTFNMVLLMGMVWMGAFYLGRFNPAWLATMFSCGFFILSVVFVYVFWLQPEIFNMASVTASLFLAFHRFGEAPPLPGRIRRLLGQLFRPATLPVWSGAVLALAVYNKPMLAVLALAPMFAFWRRRGWRGVIAFATGAVLAMALVVGVAVALTGHPTPYLGVARAGVRVDDPDVVPIEPMDLVASENSPTQNSWSWIFSPPPIHWSLLAANAGYFLWGRRTGLLLYTPFAALALVLFLIHGRRSTLRWITLAAIGCVALFFLIAIPFNWHGGGGFVGNRYFINAYPAILFLVTSVRPAVSAVVGFAASGLFLGPILFTPFGAPVPNPTLQAHVRNAPFRLFPLELSIIERIPGYRGEVHSNVWFHARRDVFRDRGQEMWIHGATTVELWMHSERQLEDLVFEVRNLAPGNHVDFRLPGARSTLQFGKQPGDMGEIERLEISPTRPTSTRWYKEPWEWQDGAIGTKLYVYKMLISPRTGQFPPPRPGSAREIFYMGSALTYLGTQQDLDKDLFALDWLNVQAPAEVEAGETFEVLAMLQNASAETWPSEGPTRVNLSYHWLDDKGHMVDWEGKRTALPRDLPSRHQVRVSQAVTAPSTPGVYTLKLDLVREKVSWFSEKNPETVFLTPVTVTEGAEGAPL